MLKGPLREVEAFRRAVQTWYRSSARSLPWRGTQDPYRVLLAEVLLQQTRVEQALGYYARFLAAFPDFGALARATEEDVLRVWAGAGYYRRARNLHRLAQIAVEEGLPRSYDGLLDLPGVGPYTAAAVASIAFGAAVAAVDGNARRVLCRLFARRAPRPRWLTETAQALLDRHDPGGWNQALMDLGSTMCTPKAPRCLTCPVESLCAGAGSPNRYPTPRTRRKKDAEAAALVLRGTRGYVLEKRDGQALSGLWGFPFAEGGHALSALLSRYEVREARAIGTVHHAFTHKRLTVTVYGAPWSGPGQDPASRPLSVLDRKILALAAPENEVL